MALLLTAPQCFFITILVFAIIGFQRGWRREVISLAFALAAVLFLYLGGGTGLANFFFVRLPIILQDVIAPNPSASKVPPQGPSQTDIFFATIVAFVVIVAVGYLVGNKAFPKPTTPAERFLGIVPGIITGYALLTYIVFVFAKSSPLLTVGVTAPSQSLVGNYILVIFLIAIVAVVIGLISASAKKGGGAKK